ncbi:MAG: DUF3159 domain-containing protein [Nocardioidaceae bacterium]
MTWLPTPGADPEPSTALHPSVNQARQYASVEQLVRTQLSKALGGPRGIVEAAIPTIGFTATWMISHDLRVALIVSAGLALTALFARLVQQQTVKFVLNALVGIAVGSVFALRSGNASDYYLPGILYNAGYAVVMVLTIVVRWPIVGFMVGSVTGDPIGWHADRGVVRLCSQLTWLLALPCVLRVVVQYPLWQSDHLGWLGTSKIVMGWPLQVAALAAMLGVLGRNHTPLEPSGT